MTLWERIRAWFRALYVSERAEPLTSPTANVSAGPILPIVAPREPLHPLDRDVLIRTVYGEARGERDAGQVAVVHVVRNRLARPQRFSTRVAGVCQAPFQFSAWNLPADANGKAMRALRPEDPAYIRIGRVVDAAWQEPDTVAGCDHYLRHDTTPWPSWAAPPAQCVMMLGPHQFWRGVK